MNKITITTFEGELEHMDSWLLGLWQRNIFTPLTELLERFEGKHIKIEITAVEEQSCNNKPNV